ncbi:MAG: hypothetical protein NTV30_00200, partial [Chloroflexi bacterium]|nr:hypothetical protein [Chloroflexota bacterium]
MIWDNWLDDLRNLTADATEWDNISSFLSSVDQIVKNKKYEREEKTFREYLEQSISVFQEQCSDSIDFFEIDCESWTVDSCPLDKVTGLAEKVGQLRDMLERYAILEEQPAVKLTEKRKRLEEQQKLENEIIQLHKDISEIFASFPEEVSDTGESDSLSVEEEAYEVNMKVIEQSSSQELLPEESKSVDEKTEYEEKSDSPEPQEIIELVVPEECSDTSEPSLITEIKEESMDTETVTVPTVEVSVEARDIQIPKQEEEIPTKEPGSEISPDTLTEKEFVMTLIPSHEAASVLQTGDTEENWHVFLWALIAEDDLPAAYWLSRSLISRGFNCPIPDWLLASVQGAQWLSSDSPQFVSDLQAIASENQPDLNEAQALLGLAAALHPSLIDPKSGLMSWLTASVRVIGIPELHELVLAINTFTKHGKALRSEDAVATAGEEEYNSSIKKVSSEMKSWITQIQGHHVRMKLKRASDILRQIVSQDKYLRNVIQIVSQDNRTKVKEVSKVLDDWQEREQVSAAINSIDRGIVGKTRPPIVGSALDQIIRDVEGICWKAQRWCELVEYSTESHEGGSWLIQQVKQLSNYVRNILPRIEKSLDVPFDSVPIQASVCCLKKSLKQLQKTLHLPLTETYQHTDILKDFMLVNAENLVVALSRRLLCLPEISLQDNGLPLDNDLVKIAYLLRDACLEKQTLRAAFDGWLNKQDYRFLDILSDALVDENESVVSYTDQLQGSKEALNESCLKTMDSVEQAVVDGIINDEERSKYSAKVEEIKQAKVLNFLPKYDELKAIVTELEERHQSRLEHLREQWIDIQAQLPITDADKRKQLISVMEEALDRRDTRVVEEYISSMEDGQIVLETLSFSKAQRDVL